MDLSKEYIGTVIYNQDPTFSGRCKIRVFGIFDDLEDEMIPWFVPINSNVYSDNGAGSISVPKLGNIVRVKFSNNDIYSGEYTALQCVDPSLIEEIKDDYDGTHVLMYDAAEELLVIYQKMSGLRIYHKGSCITLDPTGMIQAKHQNNSNVIEIDNDRIIITSAAGGAGGGDSTGTIDITSGSTVNITANVVNVNGKTVNIGSNPTERAVNGKELVIVLKEIVAALALKMPQGAPTLLGNNFNNILSNSVYITK